MRKLLCFFIFFVFILAAGCSLQLDHPTKSKSQRNVDHKDCERKVREAMRESQEAFDTNHEIVLIRKCMKMKGWE